MPVYESSMKHFTVAGRWLAIACLALSLMAAVGSRLYFGPGIWLTRLFIYAVVIAAACTLAGLIDARLAAAERRRHHRQGDSLIRLGDQNLFWSSDRDPGDDRVV